MTKSEARLKIAMLLLLGVQFPSAKAQELSAAWTPPGRIVLTWNHTEPGFDLESTASLSSEPWAKIDDAHLAVTARGNLRSATDLRPPAQYRYYRLKARLSDPVPASPAGLSYSIGNPSFKDLFVDAVKGNDDNDGMSRERAFQTLETAWRSLPAGTQTQAVRFRLLPGVHRGAYLEERRGTHDFPILIEPADGPGTVEMRPTPQGDAGSLQFLGASHVYIQDFRINVAGGDGLHYEQCDHMLARRMRINSVRSEGQDETVKVNQSQYIYIEDSDISDAGDNCIDVVGAQHGHIVRCKIHNSSDWGAYLKGGSAYWVVEGNEFYQCGTGGFTAGQGSGFQFMAPPWIHYEAYDIKVINNIIRDCEGAGLGVNGGYNILMAHNTLYRVGSRSHLVEFVHGRRGCDGGDTVHCKPLLDQGGWGSLGDEEQFIPNRNVFFMNNVVYNPPGFQSAFQHFEIRGDATPPAGSNVATPARADDHVLISGNIIWNGPVDFPLGYEGHPDAGCQSGECEASKVRSGNHINTLEPQMVNPAAGDFRPLAGGRFASLDSAPIPNFGWSDAPTRPAVPVGDPDNRVLRDRSGATRPGAFPPGAWLPASP